MKNLNGNTINLILIICLFYSTQPEMQGQALVEFETDSTLIDGTVVINDAYSLPEDAGTIGQVITTNGSGQSAWMSLSTPPAITGTYVFMTTFVCGYTEVELPVLHDRNSGQYQTSIVISNPAFDDASITRYVTHTHENIDSLVSPDSIQAPAITSVTNSLSRFHAFAMTCDQVYEILGYTPHPGTPIFEGYVIFESDEKLAVSATYTYYDIGFFIDAVNQGGAGGLGIGNSIDIERIEPIFVPSPSVAE